MWRTGSGERKLKGKEAIIFLHREANMSKNNKIKTLTLLSLLCVAVCVHFTSFPAAGKTARPVENEWEKVIRSFEAWDEKNSFPKDAVLFVGSSTIRWWKTAELFPDLDVINRGFGGAYISDIIHFSGRIVIPYKPKLIVFYAGENDIYSHKNPDRLLADYHKFVKRVHRRMPDTPIIFMSIKPTPSKFSLWSTVQKANLLIKDFCDSDEKLYFVDLSKKLLARDGKPNQQLYLDDNSHLNAKGDALIAKIVKPAIETALKD